MDYKKQVINGSEKRYQDMLSGTTEAPVRPELKVTSSKPYSTNRDNFMRRVENERKAFNDAIKRTQQCHDERMLDKSRFGGVVTTTVILALVLALFVFAYINIDLQAWAEDVLLPATGTDFSEFLEFEEGTVAFYITVIGGVIGYLGGAIALFALWDSDSCLGKLIGCHVVGCIAAIILALLLRLLTFVGGYLINYLIQPWSALIYAGIAIIVILIVGRDLESDKFKTQKWFYCLACLGIGLLAAFIISVI